MISDNNNLFADLPEDSRERRLERLYLKVVKSKHFQNAKRQSKLLHVLVQFAKAGRVPTESAIGREVFNATGFDPNADNSVRVNAGRVRRALDNYFGTEGLLERERLLLAKGSYKIELVPYDPPIPAPRITIGVHGVETASCSLGDPIVGAVGSEVLRYLEDEPGVEVVPLHAAEDGLTFDLELRLMVIPSGPNLHLFYQLSNVADPLPGGMTEGGAAPRTAVMHMCRDLARNILGCLENSDLPRPRLSKAWPSRLLQLVHDGQVNLAKRTPSGMRDAMKLFEEARTLEPAYAPAHAGLAICYILQGWYDCRLGGRESLTSAFHYAQRAVALDPDLAEAHAAYGYLMLHLHHSLDDAERELRRAIECDPSSALAHHWLGHLLDIQARWAEAAAAHDKAAALDPGCPMFHKARGNTAFFSKNYGRAVDLFRETTTLFPKFWCGHFYLGSALALTGASDEALAELDLAEICGATTSMILSVRGCVFAASGRKPDARKAIDELVERFASDKTSAVAISAIYASLGECGEAFRWLEIAIAHPMEYLLWLGVDPRFESLAGEERFHDIVQRLGLCRAV